MSASVAAMPPVSAIPALNVWSALDAYVDPVAAASQCCPGASRVVIEIVTMFVNVEPHPLERRIFQPLKSTVTLLGLNNSTNSSLAPAVPRERNSLMTICAGAGGVDVGVFVAVAVVVKVGVAVWVGVSVSVGVPVWVSVKVSVLVGVSLGVLVGVAVA